MKGTLLTVVLTFCIFLCSAQTVTYTTNSGPSFKAVNYSPAFAGANWYLPSYNDSAWIPATNGGGLQAGGSCYGPNSCVWCTGDTVIWSSTTCAPPDTSCFRKVFNFGGCGRIISADFSIVSDDFHWSYLNGHFLDSSTVRDTGVQIHLDSARLAWLSTGDNLLAVEVNHPIPYCAILSMVGSVVVDTAGCSSTSINQVEINKISISPNPARNQLTITLADFSKSYAIIVCDVRGNKIISQNTTGVNTNVDISSLANGVYIVQLKDKNGLITTQKVVKE